MLIRLLIGRILDRYEIIKISYDKTQENYNITYRCSQCGSVRESILNAEKPCILRCDECNHRIYLIGYGKNAASKKAIDFDIVSEAKYKRLRREYKKLNPDNFMQYVKYTLRKMR